jgi:hypothetical protein
MQHNLCMHAIFTQNFGCQHSSPPSLPTSFSLPSLPINPPLTHISVSLSLSTLLFFERESERVRERETWGEREGVREWGRKEWREREVMVVDPNYVFVS